MEEPSINEGRERTVIIFLCIPVSPGKGRVILVTLINFGVWMIRINPRWILHVRDNLVIDSDLCLLHEEERKIREFGNGDWQRACYVPTKSDALAVSFRRWLNKYSGGDVDWGVTKLDPEALPPPIPRDQLMDRYWSHTVNCRSCNAVEFLLQLLSVMIVATAATNKPTTMARQSSTLVAHGSALLFGFQVVVSFYLREFLLP